ncbi:MAG TPA: hypothetical protein VKU02_26335 [Gemmataceae bacterium]|nr:hypothetical protein [Gemmataceae bacterium]
MSLRTWWAAWGEVVRKLVALVASFASMAGLLIAFLPSPGSLPWWAVALLVTSAIFFVVLVLLEVLELRGQRVYRRTDAEGIRKYMHDWIEHGGRVAIWTRDMTWAQNPESRKLLMEKARRRELILCLPELNEPARELAAAGAEVYAYGAKHLEAPASRFTIARFGRDGSRVAVGRADGDTHVIDEFSRGCHPAFHLAEDLIMLVRSQKRR